MPDFPVPALDFIFSVSDVPLPAIHRPHFAQHSAGSGLPAGCVVTGGEEVRFYKMQRHPVVLSVPTRPSLRSSQPEPFRTQLSPDPGWRSGQGVYGAG